MIIGNRNYQKPIRWGLIGGGNGSQIGYIHRSAALRDFNFELVAGALDINPERGRQFGEELFIAPERCYDDYQQMFAEEAKREDGIQAVSIATPNFTHFAISKAALENGLHVICEKPLCFSLNEALELQALAKEKDLVFGVMYGYSGAQMIEQARRMVEDGLLGEIRIVMMQFAHGFHNVDVEANNESTKWRVDPKRSGPTYVLGDIGTHPLFLSHIIVPQLKVKRLMCTRQSFVKSRAPLEDNAFTIMEYESGAVAHVWSCAVNAGSMHSQKIRVIGEKASIEWWDEHPNQLLYEVQNEPKRVLDRGMPYLYDTALAEDRIGGGHSEGLFEAWSNLYARFGKAIMAKESGEEIDFWYPNINHGVEGVRWLEKCVESADQQGEWVDYNK